MERRIKERLVGAAVLMAAAIILIPEMLSGPRHSQRPATSEASDGPLKTYTIDLNRSPGEPPSAQLDERAPPPESAPATPTADATNDSVSENVTSQPQAVPESDSATAEPPPSTVQSPPRVAVRPQQSPAPPSATRETPSRPIASAPLGPTSRGWAVQFGSFASRATADRMVKDLSQRGQSAFVMPVKSGNSTLYRVRIGPFADRAAANQALTEVKDRIANAAVVAHP